MARYLSLPPDLDDSSLLALEAAMAHSADGESIFVARSLIRCSGFALATLWAMMDEARRDGDHIVVESPTDAGMLRRLAISGFFADPELELDPRPRRLFGGQWAGMPLVRITDPSGLDNLATAVWKATKPFGREVAVSTLQAAEELVTNTLLHAGVDSSAVVLVEARRMRQELVVIDRGIGIRSSLIEHGREPVTDIDGLQLALGLLEDDSPSLGLPALAELLGRRRRTGLTIRSGFGGIRIDGNGRVIEEFGRRIRGVSAVVRRTPLISPKGELS